MTAVQSRRSFVDCVHQAWQLYQPCCQEAKDRERSLADHVVLHVKNLCFNITAIVLVVSIVRQHRMITDTKCGVVRQQQELGMMSCQWSLAAKLYLIQHHILLCHDKAGGLRVYQWWKPVIIGRSM
jgi:hypothetical protein